MREFFELTPLRTEHILVIAGLAMVWALAVIAAWRLPGATFCTVEAQETSIRLARKTIRYNGLEGRFTLYQGDLRDPAVLAQTAGILLVVAVAAVVVPVFRALRLPPAIILRSD